MVSHSKNELYKKRRQYLRRHATETEKILWSRIKQRQIDKIKFRRQHSIGPYIVDFYTPQLGLAIEIDGPSHFLPENQAYESKRNAFLAKHVKTILRFQSNEIYENLEGVLITIQEKIEEIISENQTPV